MELPNTLPIFPLTGALLLPYGRLPLNIFEPRYLAMVDDALRTDRLIGMIQPRTSGALYDVGCAGRIISFEETDDGRNLIMLSGMCRFKVMHELDTLRGYRRVQPDWSDFMADREPPQTPLNLERTAFNQLLKTYFKQQGLSCSWDKVDVVADHDLVTALAMICPFEPSEKQALLEAPDPTTRAQLFTTLLELALREQPTDGDDDASPVHH